MSVGYHDTSVSEAGPWLLDRDGIRELDHILSTSWNERALLEEARIANQAEKAVRERFRPRGQELDQPTFERERDQLVAELKRRYPYSDSGTEWQVIVRGNRRISQRSLDALLADPALQSERVEGFVITSKAAGIDCTVKLEPDDQRVRIRVTPSTEPETERLYSHLVEWVEKHRPSRVVQLWRATYVLPWFLWFLALVIGAGAVTSANDPKETARNAVHGLLDDGLQPAEQLQALELLLTLESGYAKTQSEPAMSRSMLAWVILLVGGPFLCLVLTFPPRFAVALGDGGTRVQRWRWWLRGVFVAVPLFVLVNVLVPIAVDLVRGAAGG